MSTETTTSKNSILTNAMNAVRAKQNGDNSEQETNPAFKAEITRFKKLALAAAVGTVAVLAVAWTIENKRNGTDEISEEEITPED